MRSTQVSCCHRDQLSALTGHCPHLLSPLLSPPLPYTYRFPFSPPGEFTDTSISVTDNLTCISPSLPHGRRVPAARVERTGAQAPRPAHPRMHRILQRGLDVGAVGGNGMGIEPVDVLARQRAGSLLAACWQLACFSLACHLLALPFPCRSVPCCASPCLALPCLAVPCCTLPSLTC